MAARRCDTELAWAAGFFDGEGSFHEHKSHGKSPGKLAISISQKHREVLDRFHGTVGVGGVNGPYEYDQKSRRFNYRAYNRDAISVLEKLRPFLGTVKIEQAERALSSIEERADVR